jgi:hypothetical protein
MAPSPTEVNTEQPSIQTVLPKVADRAADSKHRFSKSRNGMFVSVCSYELSLSFVMSLQDLTP